MSMPEETPDVLWDRRPGEPYGAPRRFGLGTIMVLTTLFGVLLTVMIDQGVPRGAVGIVVSFIFAIGCAQVALFRGRQPRKASIIGGIAAMAAVMAILTYYWHSTNARDAELLTSMAWISFIPLGAVCGYAAGGIVAGVFLLMDLVDRLLERLKSLVWSKETSGA